MHRSKFLILLKHEFPQLRNNINKEEGLLHLEINVFHCYVQGLLLKKDIYNIEKAFNLAEKSYKHGNNTLRNAIDVSFVEGLELKNHKWAWNIFPEPLKKLHLDFHGKIYG